MLSTNHSRRRFLQFAGVSSLLAGTATLLSRTLLADPTQLALRIEQAAETHPLMPAIQKAFESLKSLDDVKDYTAIFHKEEKIGRNLAKARLEIKLREDPYSVYVKFQSPSAGREALYVEGNNNNLLYAHDVGLRGLAGTVSLDPKGSMAMEGNRHPLTLMGMRKMAEIAVQQWLDETKLQGVTVNVFPNARIGDVVCTLIESSYAKPQPGIRFQMTRLYIESEHGYPIRTQQYEFTGRRDNQPALVEDYMYTNIQANVGLQPIDFDTKNRKYGF